MRGRELLGVGAAACVACSLPLMVGAVGALGLVSTLLVGLGGLMIAAVVVVAMVVRRRRVLDGASGGPVPVELAARR